MEARDLPLHNALVPVQQRLARRITEWQKARKDYEVALQRSKNRPWEPNWSALRSGLRWPDFEEGGGYLFLKSERCVARVTEKQTGRAVEILNSVLHAASSRGYTLIVPEVKAGSLTLKRRGVDTLLRLTEHATVKEVKDKSAFYVHRGGMRREPNPTGTLRIHFRIATGTEKFLSDESAPLEHQLNELFASFAKAEARYFEHLHRQSIRAQQFHEGQARLRALELQREEERLRARLAQEVLQRERDEREDFLQRLCQEAAAWKTSQTVDLYLQHLRGLSEGTACTELSAWLERAERVAKELDPTNRRLGTF
ncbi:hypothetical protein [Achromobacter animicus]|uniref:hypothetical protein n=1 Tax=Achromobacter animicus TaxID=1389935 RepID=UPI0028A5AF9D|nr:hypothetical protein [Achromobacter animicus]